MSFRTFYVEAGSRCMKTRAIPFSTRVNLLVALTTFFFGSETSNVLGEIQKVILKRMTALTLKEYKKLLDYEKRGFDLLAAINPPVPPDTMAAAAKRIDLLTIIVGAREKGAPNIFAEGAWRTKVAEDKERFLQLRR